MNKNLALKYLTKTANKKEIKSFEIWLRKSKLHKEKYEKFISSWDTISTKLNQFNPDTDQAWNNLSDKFNDLKTKNPKIFNITRWKSIAAIALLLLAIGILARYNSKGINVFNSYTTYITNDSIKTIVLLDGTKVWLNKQSELKVPVWRKKRTVYLNGEAYFEVTHNSLNPFFVKTEYTITKVLGTSFNLSSTNQTDVISLLAGRVEFYARNNKRDKIILKPGEKISYRKNQIQPLKTKFNDHNFLAWKTGEIDFKNTSFSSVLNTIADYYNLHISNNIQDFNTYKLTANFNNQPLEKVVSILELTWNLDITIKNDTIYLYSN